ncbi:MAG: glycosyltransferase family 2 protein [Bacteroidetes bacterium]|nr:glycosyltransferase family 2 protein [Bacteroidota bacterium]
MLTSIVVPFYNEELLVHEFVERVNTTFQGSSYQMEIVAVDDGSSDNTLPLLLTIREKYKDIKIISLSRNFGLQAAIHAGIEHAKGDLIVVMDGDLQDPPEQIPELMETLLEEDLDILVGRRESRKERWPKRQFIKWFHRIIEPNYAAKGKYDTGNFSILKRVVAVALLNTGEKQRYFPGLRSYVGFHVGYFDYDREARTGGKAKMTYVKLFKLAGDALFSFSKWPIRLCFIIGLLGFVILLLAMIYILVSKKMGLAPLGWSSTFISIYFFGSLHLIFLGVVGEYIYRIYKEVQNRPLYVVRQYFDCVSEPVKKKDAG